MKALIIDDEPDNVQLLSLQLARHCPQVEVIGQFTDSPSALIALRTLRPALVFLDIEMPMLNGFQLLEQLGEVAFQVVFVTAYNQYAVRAFRFSALDYLLKPVDTVDLIAAVKRAETTTQIQSQQLDILSHYYGPGQADTPATRVALASRIALPHASGMVFVETNKIVYCEADSNYTRFHLSGGEVYMVAKTLGDVQEVLEAGDFVRVHRQYIVNLAHIQKLVRGEGTYLLMTDGTSIPLSRQQKDRLMERFGWL